MYTSLMVLAMATSTAAPAQGPRISYAYAPTMGVGAGRVIMGTPGMIAPVVGSTGYYVPSMTAPVIVSGGYVPSMTAPVIVSGGYAPAMTAPSYAPASYVPSYAPTGGFSSGGIGSCPGGVCGISSGTYTSVGGCASGSCGTSYGSYASFGSCSSGSCGSYSQGGYASCGGRGGRSRGGCSGRRCR